MINHGVNTSLVENVKKDVQEFFNLPLEQKKKFEQKQGDSEGYGQLFVVSEDQKLDWGDVFYMVTLPQEKRKPHLFPKLPSTFRFSLSYYFYYVFLFMTHLKEKNYFKVLILHFHMRNIWLDDAGTI